MVICVVPVAPLRKEASHTAEMVSQVLYGESAKLIRAENGFCLIQMDYDGYEGWCQQSQLTQLAPNQKVVDPDFPVLSAQFINTVKTQEAWMKIPMGCPIHWVGKTGMGELANHQYQGESWRVDPSKVDSNALLNIAKEYLATPYLWGGRSNFGIDCSGFVQQVYRFFNRRLPRDASQQVNQGELVGFLQESQPGDLAFFDNADGKIVHVGILISPERIIHASGNVRVDWIDQQGIVHANTKERTHQLRVIKRWID